MATTVCSETDDFFVLQRLMRLSQKRGLEVEASVAMATSRVLSPKSIRRMRLRSLESGLTSCVMVVSQTPFSTRDSIQIEIIVES